MLVVLGGLPGVGKSSIARAFAKAAPAVHLRIDSIERAIRESGVRVVTLDDAGYRVGYAVAEDNLRLGHIVVADSVNPLPLTRVAWLDVARRAGTRVLEVEILCSDVEWDLVAGTAEWSEEGCRLLGVAPGDVPATQDDFMGAVHVEDRTRVREDLALAIHDGTPKDLECRVLSSDGGSGEPAWT